ncbi:MAG TPA: hypothetical protein VMA83_07945 [Solirubrobacteraceae bacterium]|nr:hypothetical protein [Solirubrobacteraceae bacterium]
MLPLAAVYLLVAPPSGDLAAATYRSQLFAAEGFLIWDNHWYGGHYLPAYSLLSPALGALLGPRVLLALCGVLVALLFYVLARRWFPPAAVRVGAVWMGVAVAVGLLAGQVAYELGLAIGMAGLAAWQLNRVTAALILAVICSVSSPVAGAFLALAGVTVALVAATGRRRAQGLALAACALAPVGIMALLFPEGGAEPFPTANALYAVALLAVIVAVIPREHRALRIGAALYAVGCVLAYAIATPLGGNALRLGTLFAGPLVVAALWEHRRRLLILLAPFLVVVLVGEASGDLVAATGDAPSSAQSYYTPLVKRLLGPRPWSTDTPMRIEIPFTRGHWEAAWVAPYVSLARGWERQLDVRFNPIFYGGTIDAGTYRGWLVENAVSFVALPAAPLDESALAEANLIRRGLPYLREVWHSQDWRLFAVRDPGPLVSGGARMTALGASFFSLSLPRAGSYTVRVRYTPSWELGSGAGCVTQAPGDWTRVSAPTAEHVTVSSAFTLEQVGGEDPSCRR